MTDYSSTLRSIADNLAKIGQHLDTANRMKWRELTGDTSMDKVIAGRLRMQIPPDPTAGFVVF